MVHDSARALVIGAAMVDIVCSVNRLPQSGEGVVPSDVTKTVGGCALNSAAMLQHLGVEPILFAPVGHGLFSTMVKETIVEFGLAPFEPLALSSPVFDFGDDTPGGWCLQSVTKPSGYCAAASSADLILGGDKAFEGRCHQESAYDPHPGAATFVHPVPAHTDCGACICLVEPDGERTMITIPGIERHFAASWFSALSGATLRELQAAIVCGYELETPGGDDILAFLEAHPTLQVYYAPGPRVCAVPADRIARLQALGAIWHLNDQEALAYTGEKDVESAGRALARHIAAPVIVTAGRQGSYAFVPQDSSTNDFRATTPPIAITHVPSTPIVPVNTVGAGDAHLGAVVANRILGATWEEALARANEMAAAVCLIEGTTLASR